MSSDILLVDDDLTTILLLGRMLERSSPLRFASSGEDAMRMVRETLPDLLLLDAEMPGMSGFQVCKALKAEALLVDIPVIFVTGHAEVAFELAGFEIGAADFIAKPVNPSLLRARVMSQLRAKRMADELRRIASIDVLTGVANRRQFIETLERECRRARRSGEPLALLMIDVDHFKPFNDRYGHPAGDACLRAVTKALVSVCQRPADLVARYGGEEYVLLLPQTARQGAEFVAQRILDAVEALGIAHETSLTARYVTVSVGIACYDAESETWVQPSADSRRADDTVTRAFPFELVQAADKALYSAKHAGRAQARLLDVGNVGAPERVRDIVPLVAPSDRVKLDCGEGTA
jgi:diguanylate cyclase (GGDEF)-like protein